MPCYCPAARNRQRPPAFRYCSFYAAGRVRKGPIKALYWPSFRAFLVGRQSLPFCLAMGAPSARRRRIWASRLKPHAITPSASTANWVCADRGSWCAMCCKAGRASPRGFCAYVKCCMIGRLRMRWPVAAKIALVTAGAMGGSPGSPAPPSVLLSALMTLVAMSGASGKPLAVALSFTS